MKRDIAFKKIQTLCLRFDQAISVPSEYVVFPIQLWLIGSVLTDKSEPEDIDLVAEFDSQALHRTFQKQADEGCFDVIESARTYARAIRAFYADMKMVHVNDFMGVKDISDWLKNHSMPEDAPHRLIWQPSMDWASVLEDIYNHPLHHNPSAEVARKKENIKKGGIKRIEPVMKLIRRKLDVRKSENQEAIYEPLLSRLGFIVTITKDCCPSPLHSYIADDKHECRRDWVDIGRVGWVWGKSEDGYHNTIIGLEIVMFDDFGKDPNAVRWVQEQAESVFTQAKVEPLPVLKISSVRASLS